MNPEGLSIETSKPVSKTFSITQVTTLPTLILSLSASKGSF